MEKINKIFLVGTLKGEPVRTTEKGTVFKLEYKTGNIVHWVDCYSVGNLASLIISKLKNGNKIMAGGELQGNKIIVTEVSYITNKK